MTELLEQAIDRLESLGADRQDAIFLRKGFVIATLIMKELKDEAK